MGILLSLRSWLTQVCSNSQLWGRPGPTGLEGFVGHIWVSYCVFSRKQGTKVSEADVKFHPLGDKLTSVYSF